MGMSLPRFRLAVLPTPLVPARRLQAAIGGPPILVKRDDLAGFAVAGNKARPLEYLLGTAIAEECDVLVTGGGPSSNFCPAAAVAARVAHLDCHLVLYGDEPAEPHPNLLAALASGASVRFTGDPDREGVDEAVDAAAAELRAGGRRPFAVPRGGATALGAVGYARAITELGRQLERAGLEPEAVVVATGSGGTQAGLVAGTVGHGHPWRVVGAAVSRPPQQAAAQVLCLARACGSLLGLTEADGSRVEVVDAIGPGFGLASPIGERAAHLAMETEGLVLDPTYTAKALGVVLQQVSAGARGPIVFWHTGGLVAAVHEMSRASRTGRGGSQPCPS
jgi:D-cysteine desulfhydrase